MQAGMVGADNDISIKCGCHPTSPRPMQVSVWRRQVRAGARRALRPTHWPADGADRRQAGMDGPDCIEHRIVLQQCLHRDDNKRL